MNNIKTTLAIAASILLSACSSTMQNQQNAQLPINQIPMPPITPPISSSNNSFNNSNLNNISSTAVLPSKIRGSYTLPQNTPLFIIDFIKKYPQIEQAVEAAQILQQQKVNQEVIKLVSPSTQPLRKNWLVYRSKFIEPIRINAGVRFWRENSQLLDNVSSEFGVDPAAIVGIIGVESIYGRQMGNFNVLNTLYSLSFYYPESANKLKRENMFQQQLADYLAWAGTQNNYSHLGSYAGALGMPQFMPQSLLKYAVDYDKDGKINLSSSIPDVVASVANFLKQHGWKTGENVVLDVAPTTANISILKSNATGKPQATQSLKNLSGLEFNAQMYGINQDTPLLVVDLPVGNDVAYKLGMHNFYVLTRYNQSFFYALSVYELGKTIQSQL
jgi:membrane-bound lytic murein transglycosylase B